ncbi:PTS sugar transporter subunit IIB [Lonepinella koalarum]|uniref:PTS sugar transporter subunit IIB n=1 Tax=Lonepinella koalarum TaxID=53417 RepID=UPI0011E4BAC7|nr:PTS sugar transporter subunit IIB [Lonepinella koalarum]TYG34988.1 PTS sugar transporter subunit IIB [Lonepinella koalarum]
MLKIRTVCGNGIGSSLFCAAKVKKICAELNIEADIESVDFSTAPSQNADLYITVKELAKQFDPKYKVAIIRSYTNENKLKEDLIDTLKSLV